MENNAVAKSNKKLIAIVLVAIIAAVGVYFVLLKKTACFYASLTMVIVCDAVDGLYRIISDPLTTSSNLFSSHCFRLPYLQYRLQK